MNLSFKAQLKDAKYRVIEGYATTDSWDRQGEKLPLDVAKRAFARFAESTKICKVHGRDEFGKINTLGCGGVGELIGYTADDKGIMIAVKITDNAVWSKVVKGEYNGFSIGGYSRAISGVIYDLDLIEISLVGVPANGDCVFLTAKGGVKMDEELKKMLNDINAAIAAIKPAQQVAKGGEAMDEELKAMLKAIGAGVAALCSAKGDDTVKESAKGDAMSAEFAALKECAAKQGAEIAELKSIIAKLEETPDETAKGAAFDTASEGSKTNAGRKMSEVPYHELASMTVEQRSKLVNDIA